MDIAVIIDNTGGLTEEECIIELNNIVDLLESIKDKNTRIALIEITGQDCQLLISLESNMNKYFSHYSQYIKTLQCKNGFGQTKLGCGLLTATQELNNNGNVNSQKKIISINNCVGNDARCSNVANTVYSSGIDRNDIIFINAIGGKCGTQSHGNSNIISSPETYASCITDTICVANQINNDQFHGAINDCQYSICSSKYNSKIERYRKRSWWNNKEYSFDTNYPTPEPTDIPTYEPTSSPIKKSCPYEIRKNLKFDFILLFDNTCALSQQDCNTFLEGVTQIIESVLDYPYLRVQTMQFEQDNDPKTIVGFDNDELQRDKTKYAQKVRQDGDCKNGGVGKTDLKAALLRAKTQFDLTDDRIDKVIIVSVCMDEDPDTICGHIASEYNDADIQVWPVNLIKASNAGNAVSNKEWAQDYLSCLVKNDDEICIGDNQDGINIDEFGTIINKCLSPYICLSHISYPIITTSIWPTKWPSVTPTYWPTPEPTPWPTEYPSFAPNNSPTNAPSSKPTYWPTPEPTPWPTEWPTPYPIPLITIDPS